MESEQLYVLVLSFSGNYGQSRPKYTLGSGKANCILSLERKGYQLNLEAFENF